MVTRTPHGKVRFKVQRNALLLGEFTIAQLVRATGLNPESVRTEVQRLRKAGFVVSERVKGQRGARYRLSDDPEKRLALSLSVEAFYPEPVEPAPPRPTSRLYRAAVRSLDQAEGEGGRKHPALLEQVAHQLEGAWQAEGSSRAPSAVQAHILREQGRLAYLQGQRESARDLFQQAKEMFASAGLESEVRLVDEYLLSIEARRRMAVSGTTDPVTLARCVLETLEAVELSQTSPLVQLLADLTRTLSRTTKDRVAAAAFESESKEEILESIELWGERISREVHKVADERQFERGWMLMQTQFQERPAELERWSLPAGYQASEMPTKLLASMTTHAKKRVLDG